MNKALITKLVWAILNKRDSLWVQWIYDYKLKGRNFWEVTLRTGVSWSWRKILQLRPTLRHHIWSKIGNGLNTSVWFDKWCDMCPLIQYLTPRTIKTAGLDLNNSVADLAEHGEWKFPAAWYDLFPVLINLPNANLNDRPDSLCWHHSDGSECNFSSTVVWDSIRYGENKVPWVKLVWYPQCIPRHSFHMWLVLRNKLKTQDRMKWWDAGSETNVRLMCCSLCQKGPDSRSHLFFECEYSSNVLNSLKPMVDLQCTSNKLESIAMELNGATQQKTAQHVISKLLVASTTYYIWQERNQRLFTTSRRTGRELSDVIKHTVCLKLLSLRFKNNAHALMILDRWQIPPQLVFDNG